MLNGKHVDDDCDELSAQELANHGCLFRPEFVTEQLTNQLTNKLALTFANNLADEPANKHAAN